MRRWLYISLIVFLVYTVLLDIYCRFARAQEAGQPVALLNGEYIRKWLVLGPFFPDDLDEDLLADMGGEANINPKEGDTVTTADGKTLTWKRYTSKGNIIDLLSVVGNYEYATAYAFSLLQSRTANNVEIRLGSDDGIAVWVDGRRVHYHSASRSLILDEDGFEVDLRAGENRCLVKVSQGTKEWNFAMRALPPDRAVISGFIANEKGEPIHNANVRLEQDNRKIAQVRTDASGSYRICVYPVHGPYDLSATLGTLGTWRLRIRLRERERQVVNITLKEAISIEGTLLMLDYATPHVAVAVQAVMPRRGEPRVRPIATTLSDKNGKYQFINLKPGRYQVRCQVLNGYVYYEKGRNGRKWEYEEAGKRVSGEVREWVSEETQDESASPSLTHSPTHPLTRSSSLGDTLRVEPGKILEGINFRFAPFKKGTWRNHTYFDGLASNYIWAIDRDLDGAMWFGTYGGGVSRYDGKTFANLTTQDGLASNEIHTIHRDLDGAMWFGTYRGGVSRYDGRDTGDSPHFVNFTAQDGLDDIVYAVYGDSDGILWFGTSGGAFRYDGKEFVNLGIADGLMHKNVRAIHGAPDGIMWFGTDGGVSRYNGKTFANFSSKDGLGGNIVRAIHREPDGILWFGTNGGASRYDGRSLVNFTTRDGLAHENVRSIHQDSDGVLWFGTFGGISRYDGSRMGDDSPHFVNFTTQDGLAYDRVYSIYRDPDGVMWFGTWGSGVSCYDEESFINFTIQDGLAHNSVNSIYRDSDGVMWFGTEGGVSRYDDRGVTMADSPHFVNFTTQDGLPDNNVNAIYQGTDGVLWFGTDSGVSRYDGRGKGGSPHFVNFTIQDGLPDNSVNVIHQGTDGVMWFGTDSGVSRYDGRGMGDFPHFTNFTIQDGLVYDYVEAICCDPDGVIWFGTAGGVSRYDGSRMGDFPHFVNFTKKEGLIKNYIFAVYRDPDGFMWFGTYGGVSRYDGKAFVSFTAQDGLKGDAVNVIHRDPDRIMWFGTDSGGVSLYDGFAWTSLDTRDGLAGNDVRDIYQDPDGSLWFATKNGVTRYRRSSARPKVRIVSVQADQVYTDLAAIPSITAGARVTIAYNAIDFKTLPEKRQCRYRVVEKRDEASPGDEDWQEPTAATSFDWTPKKPGAYTFEVQAIDRDLNYSEPDRITVQIVPPWYLNGWIAFPSAGSLSVLLISSIFFSSRYYAKHRESQRLEQETQRLRDEMLKQEREKNVQLEVARNAAEAANRAKSTFLANMSHELRTPMNAILGYAQILLAGEGLQPAHRSAVETIGKSGHHMLALINEILDLSRIEAGRVELLETDFDLTALVDELSVMFKLRCEQKGLIWRVEWDISTHFPVSSRVLVHGDELKLRQVLGNLLSNAVKFTESGEVVLRISEATDEQMGEPESLAAHDTHSVSRFTFEVIDTGVGIPPEEQKTIFEPFQQGKAGATESGTGLGLAIARAHIELMGGQLGVASEIGTGSRFFFTVSLPLAASEGEHPSADARRRVAHLAEGYSVKALVADDSRENREVLANMLSDIGCQVLLAENGQQTVQAVGVHRPDIVFMDIRMPVMDGLTATQQIIGEYREDADKARPKIVAVSASAFAHERQRYLKAGFDAFIAKPFRAEEIYEKMASLLHIEYEYVDVEAKSAAPLDLPKITLPDELLVRLKEAAEFYNFTALRRYLNEVARLGPDGHQLAQHLQTLVNSHDMESVRDVLSEIENVKIRDES